MTAAGQRAGRGVRLALHALMAAMFAAGLVVASSARAASGSLASIERDPNFAWSSLNITAGTSGFDAITGDPTPWEDAATQQPCIAAADPDGHVITWCRDPSDTWHQSDMTSVWGGPAAAGVIREVGNAHTGQSNLFYRDAGGEMWALDRDASGTWTPVNLTATYGLSPLGSDPWPLTDVASGQECAVAAISPAGHVTEWCRQSDNSWLQVDLTAQWGGPGAVGTVVPGVDPTITQSNVFFRDAGGGMWSLTRQSGGNWIALNITASSMGLSPIASDPMPVDPPTGQLCVAAVLASPAGDVAEFCRTSVGTWLEFDLTAAYGGPRAVGNVEPLVDPELHQAAFFFHDAAGTLWTLTRSADGHWTPSQIMPSGGAPILITDPEPLVDPQSNEPVVVAGLGPPAMPTTPSPPVTVTTPVPTAPSAIHAQFVISWRWDGFSTVLRSIHVRHLPRRARVAVSCKGPDCPPIHARATGPRRIAQLLKQLAGRRFAPGDVMSITVTAPRLRRERIQLHVRRGRVPLARLLKG